MSERSERAPSATVRTSEDHTTSEGNAFATTERPDYVALVGALLTGLAHLATARDNADPRFVIGACVFWSAYVLLRSRSTPSSFREWGFRRDNLREATVLPLTFFGVSAFGLAIFAITMGHFTFPPHTLLLLVLYPIWGTIQQLLVLGILIGNLSKIPVMRASRPLLIATGSLLFAFVHWPQWWLVGATFFLACLYVPHFLRYRNVWPLGLVHGWLGSLFYLWGLNRDPLLEVFG